MVWSVEFRSVQSPCFCKKHWVIFVSWPDSCKFSSSCISWTKKKFRSMYSAKSVQIRGVFRHPTTPWHPRMSKRIPAKWDLGFWLLCDFYVIFVWFLCGFIVSTGPRMGTMECSCVKKNPGFEQNSRSTYTWISKTCSNSKNSKSYCWRKFTQKSHRILFFSQKHAETYYQIRQIRLE